MEYFQSFLFNAAVLIVTAFTYMRISYFFRQQRVNKRVYNGILFGLSAVVVMSCPIRFMPGVIFDTRSIIISIAGFFGGPIVAAIAILLAGVYRIIQGGMGTITGLVVIVASGAVGVGYYYFRKTHSAVTKPLYIYLFGLIVHIIMLFCMFTLPFNIALDILAAISLPVIIIYPLVSFLIVYLLFDQDRLLTVQGILDEKKKLQHDLLKNLSAGVVVHAPDTRIIQCNLEASKLFGIPKERMLGKADIDSGWNFIHEDGSKAHIDKYPINQVLSTLQPLTGYTIGINRAKDDLVWVLVNAFPEFDLKQQLTQVVVTFTDITKIKQAKILVEKQQKELAVTLNSIGDGIITTDLNTLITGMNPEAEKLIGFDFSEAEGLPLHKVFNIVDSKTLKPNPVKKIQNNVKTTNLENHNILISRDGSKCHVSDSCFPIQNEKGDISGTVLVFRDITEGCRTRAAIKERVKELECLRNLSEILETKTSLEKIFKDTLSILPAAFQYPKSVCAKITVGEVEYKTDNYKQTRRRLSTDIKGFGKLDICYLADKSKDGQNVFLQEEYELVNIITERLARAVDREYISKNLISAKEEAECANQAKNEFLANMSHEMRSPLNGLLGFSGIMEDTLSRSFDCKYQDVLLKQLDIIKTCGQNVTELINDILEFSDIKREKIESLLDSFSPEQLIAESIKILKFKAEEKSVKLAFQHDNLPLELIGAKRRLKQIIFNLIGNAIKFTDKGSVTVEADYEDGNLLIEVKDTGIGIPADMQERILEP
ncbi:MAG: PAS domain S-box protein, partial [Victivallales bacterium]|nr:PAS domain S-box protein [Victivallales bacterium]